MRSLIMLGKLIVLTVKIMLVLAILTPLVGFPLSWYFDQQRERQAIRCHLEALRAYPDMAYVDPRQSPVPKVETAAMDYSRLCMEAEGYELDVNLKQCSRSHDVSYHAEWDAGCWLPGGGISRVLYQIKAGS